MQTVVEAIITGIVFVVQVVPIGTNISLARLLWMLVNGSLLVSRGATHGGCKRVRLHQKKSAVASDFRRVLLQTTVKQTQADEITVVVPSLVCPTCTPAKCDALWCGWRTTVRRASMSCRQPKTKDVPASLGNGCVRCHACVKASQLRPHHALFPRLNRDEDNFASFLTRTPLSWVFNLAIL